MNNDKAREFFSSYYEGTLDFGLTQSFEQKLRNDAALMADYAAFVETMNELDAMRYEEIEVPIYLSDRIATRIEQVADKRRSTIPAWMVWFRGLSIGAAAAAAVGLAFVSLSNFRTEAPVATGSITAPDLSADHLNFRYKDGEVLVQYKASGSKTIVVSSGVTGSEMERFDLNGNSLESPLKNELPDTALFDVSVAGENQKATVAIPGTNRQTEKTGSGDLKKFAAALAGFYKVPVLLEIADAGKPVTWDFTDTDPRQSANKSVSTEGYSVDQRPSGMIVIMDR